MSLESFNQRWPENVKGKHYVDDTCLDCDLCRETAPENFSRNDEEGYSYISKQAANIQEAELIQESIEGCPCESIFDDGNHEYEMYPNEWIVCHFVLEILLDIISPFL